MKKRVIAFIVSVLVLISGGSTVWAAEIVEESVPYSTIEKNDVTEVQEENESEQKNIITGFQKSDISERSFYVSKEDKPSWENLLSELPDTLNVYLDNSENVVSIPVSYECVGEDYDSADSYYFQLSPVWDDEKYQLSESMDRCQDAPYYAMFLYDSDMVSELSVTGNGNEGTVYRFLVGQAGMSSAGACGIMANIQKESGFNPHATGDNGTSYGICQWHNGRWTAMKNWCKSHGYDSTTLNGQLNYLKFELSQNNSSYLWNGKTIYNKMLAVSNSAQGAYDAGYTWCYYYEVPANKSQVSVTRGNLAKNSYWKEYANYVVKPSEVGGLKIGGRATDALRLNWNKNESAAGYIIEQKKNGTWSRIARIGSNSTVTYRVEKLSASTTYQFRIKSFNFNGNTPVYSDYQYINGKTNPPVVTGLKIGGWAKDALRLNWNKNSKAAGYIIQQYKDGKWVRIARIGTNSTVTYRVSGLKSGTTYKFRVQSFNFDGSTPLYSSFQYVNGTTYK